MRDLVRTIQRELRQGELAPERARELLVTLTALLGNTLEEIREADAAYAKVLLACLESSTKANRATIQAQCTPEFARKQEARDTRELVVEMTRSLKYYLRSLAEEMQLSR